MNSDGKETVDRRSTPEARALATARIRLVNLKRHLLAKCGAKGRTTGEPCGNLAMKNGRCRLHGGRVPKGAAWHRPVWPKADTPDGEAKLNRKLADLDKRAKKRAKRLAKRSAEALAEHAEWQKTHRPGDPKKRQADRVRRRQDRDAQGTLHSGDRVDTVSEIDQAALARLRAIQEAKITIQMKISELEGGIFG